MDIFLQDPTEIPLPPNEIRIRQFRADPWEDKRRVKIYLEITPFQVRPNCEIQIVDLDGNEVANISIIETIDPKMELTLHLRTENLINRYTASVSVYYFIEEETAKGYSPEGDRPTPSLPTEITVVDRAQTTFSIEA